MERLKRWGTNPWIHLYLIALVGAAGVGRQSTLQERRETYQRLSAYYANKARSPSPQVAARYNALTRKYQDAAERPWTLAPPKEVER